MSTTTTIAYTPDPEHILAKASKLAAAMQAFGRQEPPPTTPRSLRFNPNSGRRPSDGNEQPPKSPILPFRALKETSAVQFRGQRSNTVQETHLLAPHSPGLERAATVSNDSSHTRIPSSGAGLLKTISHDPWPLRKSSDEPRPFEDPSRTRDNPLPTLSHDDILIPISARDHAVEETSPLPTTPRLRDSTFMPDHRKLKWAHPDSGKFKPRPSPSKEGRSPRIREQDEYTAAAAPILPVPVENFNPVLRDSVKSSTTYMSSVNDVNDVSATERSSTYTNRTSASELLSPYGTNFARVSLDSDFGVDDYISLYAQGFEDDPPVRTDILAPSLPNKPTVSSPLRPGREDKVPPVPKISIPPASKTTFPEIVKPNVSAKGKGGSTITGKLLPSHSTSAFPASPSAGFAPASSPDPGHLLDASAAASHGRITSAQLFAGEFPAEDQDLSFLEPPPDPNADRYGFKKDNQYITVKQYDDWNTHYRQYLVRRREKWIELMKQYRLDTGNPIEFPPRSDKVKRFIRKGIPPEWRGAAWFWYAGGPARLAQNRGLYKHLLDRCQEYTQLGESDREHIERDLYRTFPDNDKFRRLPNDPNATRPGSAVSSVDASRATHVSAATIENYERPMIGALRRVLRAFAVHQPRIGYCQSLNFLAGQMLLFLDGDEEKAFTLLCILTTEHLPGTHGIALEGANVDIGVLMGTLKDREPQLWAKLDDRAADPSPTSPFSASRSRQLPTVSLATTSWFMSVFVGSLPVEPCCRVWDVLFYEGSKTLFRIALGIFRLGSEEIKRIRDPMEIFQIVQMLPRKLLDANALMEASFGKTLEGRGLLSSDTVARRREERREVWRGDRSEREAMSRGRSESVVTSKTAGSGESDGVSTRDGFGVTDGEEGASIKRSTSRGASLKKFARWRTRRDKVPAVPGMPT